MCNTHIVYIYLQYSTSVDQKLFGNNEFVHLSYSYFVNKTQTSLTYVVVSKKM